VLGQSPRIRLRTKLMQEPRRSSTSVNTNVTGPVGRSSRTPR